MISRVKLPPMLSIDEHVGGSTIQQLIEPGRTFEATVANYRNPQLRGKLVTAVENAEDELLVIEKQQTTAASFGRVFLAKLRQLEGNAQVKDLSKGKWWRHPRLSIVPSDPIKLVQGAIRSWSNAFSYIEENALEGIKGLRSPQIGAVHAAHAHWAVSSEPATIVMPTGTGKTEVMLSILVSKPCERVLVVVPTDALRTQIANKFSTLGILKDEDCGVLSKHAAYPVVGILRQRPKSIIAVDEIFSKCNVVVTTSQIAGQCAPEVQERMAYHCPFLFIDEAHHVAAPTWAAFKKMFESRRILQFTATPFREDDHPVDGKVIFRYSLKKAQDDGYFKPILFNAIVEFDLSRADRVIAAKAVEQLRRDARYNHILMARVSSVERAGKVFSIYQQYQDFNPVQIHTGITSKTERDRTRQKIISGESKIVVLR